MILSAISGFRGAYSDLQKYGWNYNQTIIVYNELTQTDMQVTETISVSSKMFATGFLAMFGAVFLINNYAIKNCYILEFKPSDENEMTGITFPLGDPETWDLGVDLRTRVVSVMLNDVQIDFPLIKILGWVEKHEKQKMEDAK